MKRRYPSNAEPASGVDLRRPMKASTAEMNSLERDFAIWLASHPEVAWSAYGRSKLRLADNTWYTPDFWFQLVGCAKNHYVEVKGSWNAPHQDDSKVKIKVAAEENPQCRFWVALRSRKSDPWMLQEYGSSALALQRRGIRIGGEPVPDALDARAIASISSSVAGAHSGLAKAAGRCSCAMCCTAWSSAASAT